MRCESIESTTQLSIAIFGASKFWASHENGFLCQMNIAARTQTRVLHVCPDPVFDLGGVGQIVQWLAADLATRYRVSLAAPQANDPGMPDELVAAMEERINIPRGRWNGPNRRRFLEQVRQGGFSLVHFHGGAFAFDGHLPWRSPLHRLCFSGIPWMLSDHYAPSLTDGLFPPAYPLLAKWSKTALAWSSKVFLLAFCKQEVFDSDENRMQIGRWFPWARRKMRTIYHSGLVGSAPAPRPQAEIFTIGNLGHFAWRKGQHDLLNAFILARHTHPHLRLIMAGPGMDGECGRWVRQEVARQKLDEVVSLPGGLKDKSEFWNTVDLYVQPSRAEGAPMALMEALWHGKPAIGTAVSGIPEIIQGDVNGLLVDAAQPERLASAIVRLATEPDTCHRFIQNGARHVLARGMTRKDMSEHYAALYESIIRQNYPTP